MENKAEDYQSVVFMANFHDQAHLINDFKKIIGETPKAFFSRNLDNVRVISGL
jgi:AraC-like DNA-binding protein